MSSRCIDDVEELNGQVAGKRCERFHARQLNARKQSEGTPIADFFREHAWYKLRLGRGYADLLQELSLWTLGAKVVQQARRERAGAQPLALLDLSQLDAEVTRSVTSEGGSYVALGRSAGACSAPAMVQAAPHDGEFLRDVLQRFSALLRPSHGQSDKWDIESCELRLAALQASVARSTSLVGIGEVASRKLGPEPPPARVAVLQHGRSVKRAGRADLGDEVQSLPGAQLAPYIWDFVDRDELAMPEEAGKGGVTLLMNGRLGEELASKPLWQQLHPILTTIIIGEDAEGKLSGDQGFRELLKKQDSVGASDVQTLRLLERLGARAHLSGCATLLLRNPLPASQRHRGAVLLDGLPLELERAVLPGEVAAVAERLGEQPLSDSVVVAEQHLRTDMAYDLLRRVSRARLVVTTQLPTAMLCAAVDTPVVYVQDRSSGPSRTSLGTSELFHTVTWEDGRLLGLEGFDWGHPPPNPGGALRDRYRASSWDTVRQHPTLLDAARTYGVVPFHLSKQAASAPPMTFHFVQSTSADSLDPEQQRAIESVFYHHPNARVNVYLMDKKEVDPMRERLAPFGESGYDVRVRHYDLERHCLNRFKKESDEAQQMAHDFLANLHIFSTGSEWMGHFTDLARVCILYYKGGVYLDTDILLLKPFDDSYRNVIGIMKRRRPRDLDVNCAVMKFDVGNKFVRSCIADFISHYSNKTMKCWTCGGPATVTRAWRRLNFSNTSDVTVLEPQAFYPIYWNVAREVMWSKPLSDPNVSRIAKDIERSSVTLHFWRHISNHRKGDPEDSLAMTLLRKYCVFCNRKLF